MNAHYAYFILLLSTLIVPLTLSFDRKVRFITRWRSFIPAILIPAVIYIIWDFWFTDIGIWSFNPDFISGYYWIGLPLEEILFFFIVPYSCLFIYQCLSSWYPNLRPSWKADNLFLLIAIILLVAGIFSLNHLYTCITFLSAGGMIIFAVRSGIGRRFNSRRFLIAYGIILLPFLIINGFLTALPVLIYNSNAISGLKIYTIPIEDVFYGMLLFLLNVIIYERREYKSSQHL